MNFTNEGEHDRAIRILVGFSLLAAGWGFASGMSGVVIIAVGIVALGTGIVGWCPAYTAFGISSRKVSAGHCPNCDAANQP